jgi:hypothetical protein
MALASIPKAAKKLSKNLKIGQAWWVAPVIPATWEVVIGLGPHGAKIETVA